MGKDCMNVSFFVKVFFTKSLSSNTMYMSCSPLSYIQITSYHPSTRHTRYVV